MVLYAAQRPRRARQFAADLFVALWICLWAWQGWATWSSLHSLTEPAQKTESAATGIAESMNRAGDVLGAVPLLGETVAEPFRAAAGHAERLASGAAGSEESLTTLAWKLGLGLALAPSAVLLAFHLPVRIRFARRAAATRAYLAADGGPDLLALRALAHQRPDVLRRVAPDPAAAWRAGEPAVVRTLAALELHRAGLEVPEGIDVRVYLDG
ncbi:hypothetical protein [Nocardioides sp. AE5]|uniref:hypothetical protein n=1 Tax=Nocardioides sp. AE5 TaxID=2962573 RepID=UPI0028824088|nr:hypothetical protein [Nocardioides sp. AE5]MDT0203586.1 hypothetical protein [Nocardioides sp. AE5]